jgi:hypothetical protein
MTVLYDIIARADTVVGAVILVITTLALAWAITRSQALSAWKDAAGGYKEQVAELTARLETAEKTIEELNFQIATLAKRPDMGAAIDSIEANSTRAAAEVVRAMREMLVPLSRSIDELLARLRERQR